MWVNERTLIAAVTQFFNTYVLQPHRVELPSPASPRPPTTRCRQAHREQDAGRLVEIQTGADNLLRAPEMSADTNGQIFERVRRRMDERNASSSPASAATNAASSGSGVPSPSGGGRCGRRRFTTTAACAGGGVLRRSARPAASVRRPVALGGRV